MIEKNTFADKLFLSEKFSDFNLFFMWKMYPPTCPPLSGKRITPLFPSNQTLKVEVFSSLPLSENLVGGSTFQQKGGRGGCTLCIMLSCITIRVLLLIKLLQAALKLRLLENFCLLNLKERGEDQDHFSLRGKT